METPAPVNAGDNRDAIDKPTPPDTSRPNASPEQPPNATAMTPDEEGSTPTSDHVNPTPGPVHANPNTRDDPMYVFITHVPRILTSVQQPQRRSPGANQLRQSTT